MLDPAPDWVLAEHGRAFEFNAEDFRRRVRWGRECAKAADAICPSGSLRREWDLNRVHVEPLVQKARPGDTLRGTVVATNPLERPERLPITLEGRGVTADQTLEIDVPAAGTAQRPFTFTLGRAVPPGRHILPLRVSAAGVVDAGDPFLAVDVVP